MNQQLVNSLPTHSSQTILHKLTYVALALILCVTSCQKDSFTPTSTSLEYKPNFILAKTTGELAALRKNSDNNLVRTLDEYDKAVNHSPLAKLPTYIRARFRESIVFRTNIGVVSVRYLDIEQRLTEDEFAQVMSMFGIDTKHGFWGFSRDAAVIKILSESTSISDREAPGGGDPTSEGSDHKNYICSKTFKHTCEPQVGSVCLSGC